MPPARGVKRAASKSSTSTASTATAAPKNKKKRGAAVHLEIPSAPKKRGRVFTSGQGDFGQLGLGEGVTEITKFKHVPALGDKIIAVCAGGMHTVALDSSGKVWTYGCNDEGALGRTTNSEKEEGTPKKVTLPVNAVAISAGDSHSAALLENGDVYAWGSFRDSHGSMGLVVRGREGKACRAPVQVEVGEPAVAIASGSDHLVILTSVGAVYTMGCGEQGQLGRLTQRSASRDARQGFSALLCPGRVTLKGGASGVWAGYHATFVLDGNQEKVFAFGLNNYGQLGITGEKRKVALYAPVECDAFTRLNTSWRHISAGQHHSLALTTQGQVHAVGRCEYGRLGLGEGAGDAESLEPVPKLVGKKCVSIAAGTSNSFAVTDTGEVWSWGMGSEGQLGTGETSDEYEPAHAVCVALLDHRPTSIAAGGQHSVLLVEDPNPKKEPSPEPESETAEEKMEANEEDETEEKPRAKRQKKEQEGEVTSTSSAQPSQVSENTKPEKLNGDENKDTAMEVDETDNQEPQEKETDNTEEKSTPESEQQMDKEIEKTETKQDTIDTSSQDTSENDSKSQDSQDSEKSQDSNSQESEKSQESQNAVSKDVEMTEKAEVNGTEESEKVETKSMESIQTPLTTTA